MSNAIKIQSETVKCMRKEFPKPKRADFGHADDENRYCVLGAMYKYTRRYLPDVLACVADTTRKDKEPVDKFLDRNIHRFPNMYDAGKLLCRLNCSLDKSTAQDFAHRVLRLNDEGKFGQAWSALSEALLYKPSDAESCV